MSKGKILITEDNESFAFLAKRMVSSLGYEVIGVANTGEKAIELAFDLKPDLILMDISLFGNMDGIEAAGIINKKLDVPIIFLTAFSDEKTISRAMESGSYGYIIKPFELKTLKTTLEFSLYKSKTDRKIRENELWWKSSFNSIDESIIMTTKEGHINYINPAAELLLGYNLEECKGLNYEAIYKMYKRVTNEYFICAIQDYETDPEELLNSKWLIDRKNIHIAIEENITDIKNSNGDFLGKIIIIKDITQKRESQLVVVAARNFYISLLDDFPVPVWRANTEGFFNYFNKTWLELTGNDISQEVLTSWIERIHEDDRANFKNLFQNSFKEKKRFEFEFQMLNKDNKYSWIYAVGTPFNDLHKKFGGFLFAGIDLTNRKNLEKELRTAVTKAEVASKAKSNFIANMSHEIRTPLNGIFGLTEILFDTKLSTVQNEYLGMVKQSSQELLDLLNSLLSQSKSDAGRDILVESIFSLNELIDEIWKPIAYQASLKQLAAEKRCEINCDKKIIGDKTKIQQVISNLLNNAMKFTDKGKIELLISDENKIEFSDSNKADLNLHIIVKDTGIGISEDQHERIFESFTQLDSGSTKKYAGIGLGLSIVKNIVNLYDGEIWINSQVGEGTEFHVLLVLKYAEEIKEIDLALN